MYKLLLALACVTANQEDAKPSRGLRGLRFASFVNTDKGGPEASKCLKEGGDCKSCCGGCAPKTIAEGTDFSGEAECVCFEGSFDSQVDIKLSNHDDCATVVRQGEAQVTIKGEDGVDAIHMASPDASQDSGAAGYNTSPGQIYVWTGHNVYGENYYLDIGDGGNFMSCVGDGNRMRGGRDGDDIFCVGNKCDVDGRAGDDNVYVENPNGPDLANPDVKTWFVDGGDGDYDTCIYNGEKVDYDDWANDNIDGYVGFVGFGCENPLYQRPPILPPILPPKGSK